MDDYHRKRLELAIAVLGDSFPLKERCEKLLELIDLEIYRYDENQRSPFPEE